MLRLGFQSSIGFWAIAMAGVVAASANPQIIAVSGDLAPDGDGNFATLIRPELNDAGQVSFVAFLQNASSSIGNNAGIFVGDGVSVEQIARAGQTAPEGDASFFVVGSATPINDLGQIIVSTNVRFASRPVSYLGDSSGLVPIAFASADDFSLNDAGQVAYSASPVRDDHAVVLVDGSTSTRIVTGGQMAPDGNGEFSSFNSVMLNNTGQVAFRGFLRDNGGITQGVFLADGENVVQIALEGQTIRNVSRRIGDIGDFAVNDAGQVALSASLFSILSSDLMLYWDGTSLTQLASRFDTEPGGNGFFDEFRSPAINNSGQVAFVADLGDTTGRFADDGGIYRGDGTTLELLVREGELTPGLSGTFTSYFSDPRINDAGQVAFMAFVTPTSGTPNSSRGIFLYDDVHGLMPVAQLGDLLLGSSITSLDFSNGFFGSFSQQGGLNQRGQITYRFELADGRNGIALWSIPIPEPTTSSLLLLTLSGAMVVRLASRLRFVVTGNLYDRGRKLSRVGIGSAMDDHSANRAHSAGS